MLGLGNEWHLSSFRGTQELYNKTKQKKKKKGSKGNRKLVGLSELLIAWSFEK